MPISKKTKKILIIFIILLFLFIVGYIGIYMVAKMSPKLPLSSNNMFMMYDQEGNSLSETSEDWIKLNNISPYLIDATISVEDKKFYKHHGFDYFRMAKAMFNNIKARKTLEGASTITQQYAKNLFLDFDKTWKRKIEEAWITLRIETHYSKDDILEGYLNSINYGGVYGVEKASRYYFNKSAKDLNLAEASILAGIPKSPSNYSPIANPKKAKQRQKLILNSMVKNGYITENQKEQAEKTELTYVGHFESENSDLIMYYQDAVLKELKTIGSIPTSLINTGGLKIYTTFDSKAQQALDESIQKYMNPDDDLQISSVVMNPQNGNVLAITGGKNYSKSQFNRVNSSNRQVGSTMKPFLYYTALESGFTSSTTFTSEKTTFTFSGEKTYAPENYGNTYANKSISLAAALAYSDNIFAVKTHLFLGEETLVDFAKRLGISSNLEPVPSLALGTNEINIINMMQGYAAFANEGSKVKPHYITKVEDINGNILYEYKDKTENILNKSTVYILNELLSNCYNKNFIDYTNPTCTSISGKISKKYAIKTGTTNTDHWIFGYNKDVLIGTWLGYDDNRETKNKDSSTIKNIWVETIEKYLEDKEDNWYQTPDNVVGVLVDPISGEVATEKTKKKTLFYYIKGTQPNANQKSLEEAIATLKERPHSN